MSKKLIAYFSASGSTAKLAKTLAAAADAALYEIRPAVPYERRDLNWMDKKARSTVEMQDKNCRPALADHDAPVADADVIFVGFPVWWYTAPTIINTFIENASLDGVTVIPFATSGGSEIEPVLDALSAAYPDIAFGEGRLLNDVSPADIEAWVAQP